MPTLKKKKPKSKGLNVAVFNELMGKIVDVPEDWIGDRSAPDEGESLECKDCDNYKELVTAWRKAMKWTDGLDCALSVMLASSMSTNLVGEQLWVKILGPPSCGKTTLVEGLAVNKQRVFSKDTIRGFYSGFQGQNGEDESLAAKCRGMTLSTKDGDTLLKAPNLQQILSEGRGLYDRVGRTHYRNAHSPDYEGHRMTWLLCGTESLREIDDSELGARFIDCVVMDNIDPEFEDEVAWRAVNQEYTAMNTLSNADVSSQYPPDLAEAMSLTGGYLEYLHKNVEQLVSGVHLDSEQLRLCTYFGKFVAFMRARPPQGKKADAVEASREFSARLVKQMVRLCKVLSAVLNRKHADEEVIRRLHKVAVDTSRGITLQICDRLILTDSLEAKAIAIYTHQNRERISSIMRFLRRIGVAEQVPGSSPIKWQLSDMMRRLYGRVMETVES